MDRDAVISECGRYRYLLRRAWDHEKPRALVVMLNPSTADATVDDPTIRSVTRLLQPDWGSFEVANLFAWRARDPRELWKAKDPVGPQNAQSIASAMRRCEVVICAWGAHPAAIAKAEPFIRAIKTFNLPICCLGKTQSGAPRHPLYIKTGTSLQVYP
jgi:hypothetical protein